MFTIKKQYLLAVRKIFESQSCLRLFSVIKFPAKTAFFNTILTASLIIRISTLKTVSINVALMAFLYTAERENIQTLYANSADSICSEPLLLSKVPIICEMYFLQLRVTALVDSLDSG